MTNLIQLEPVRYLVLDGWDDALGQEVGHDVLIEKRRQMDGSHKWVVLCGSEVLTRSLTWVRDPSPSWRTDEHMAATRFSSMEEALALVSQVLPAIQAAWADRRARYVKEG